MEIKYTTSTLDPKIFQKKELYGLYDKNSNFIQNRIENIDSVTYNEKKKTKWFLLTLNTDNKELQKKLKSEFEISSKIENKRLSELTTYELTSVLIIKALILKANVIILEYIDAFLTASDFKRIMLHIKNILSLIDKTIIFSANKIDNMIITTNNYIITSEDRIIYNGNNINNIHEATDIMEFVDKANKKGAKLTYYKDPNDLLKAIYRSIKKRSTRRTRRYTDEIKRSSSTSESCRKNR